MRFVGGPVDGGLIRLEPQYSKYLIPVRSTPLVGAAPKDAVPEAVTVLCYVYERRGDYLIYVGEQMK